MKNLYVIAFIFMIGCAETKSTKSVYDVVKQDKTLLLDVRTVEEYNEAHIEGSVNIPLQTLPHALDSLKTYEYIVVFCRSGRRSAEAKSLLNKNGFNNVYDAGGKNQMQEILDKVK